MKDTANTRVVYRSDNGDDPPVVAVEQIASIKFKWNGTEVIISPIGSLYYCPSPSCRHDPFTTGSGCRRHVLDKHADERPPSALPVAGSSTAAGTLAHRTLHSRTIVGQARANVGPLARHSRSVSHSSRGGGHSPNIPSPLSAVSPALGESAPVLFNAILMLRLDSVPLVGEVQADLDSVTESLQTWRMEDTGTEAAPFTNVMDFSMGDIQPDPILPTEFPPAPPPAPNPLQAAQHRLAPSVVAASQDSLVGSQNIPTDPNVPYFIHSRKLAAFGLVILMPFGVIVCVAPGCEYGITGDHIHGHMHGEKHRCTAFTEKLAKKCVKDFGVVATSKQVRRPSGPISPIPGLAFKDGFQCSVCACMSSVERLLCSHLTSCHRNDPTAFSIPCRMQTLLHPNQSGYIRVFDEPIPEPKTAFEALMELRRKKPDLYEHPILDQTNLQTQHPFTVISNWGNWVGDSTWTEIDTVKKTMDSTSQQRQECFSLLQNMYKFCSSETYVVRCIVNSAK